MERDLQRPTTSPGRSSQHVVTGRWLFSFAVSAPRPLPPADAGRAILARRREGSFCTFLTSEVVTMQRAYASRVGVFLRDFLSFFFEGSCPVSGAVVSCVHDLRLWSTRSQGLQLWWGGGAFVGDAFPAVVACVLARLFSFAKKKPTVDLRVVPRRLGRAALESPCTDPSTQWFPCNRKSISR